VGNEAWDETIFGNNLGGISCTIEWVKVHAYKLTLQGKEDDALGSCWSGQSC
jgi:hypothetical protein